MFEAPQAKRVRREDLASPEDSDWDGGSQGSDAEALQARLNAQIARSLGLDPGPAEKPSAPEPTVKKSAREADSASLAGADENKDVPEGDGDEEYEFRLFRTVMQGHKVVLESDAAPRGSGGLVTPRPASSYILTDADKHEGRRRCEAMAVTGDDVLARSQCRWWSAELPWKAVTATASRNMAGPSSLSPSAVPTLSNAIGGVPGQPHAAGGSFKTGQGGDGGGGANGIEVKMKRARPGKKWRIAARTKARAEKSRAEAAARQMMDKEEHTKEKKKRLNRLKKLRKRAKDKEKKTAGRGEGEGEEDGESDLGSGSGSG